MKLLLGSRRAVLVRAANRETTWKGSHNSLSRATVWGARGKENSGKQLRAVNSLRMTERFGLEGTSKLT